MLQLVVIKKEGEIIVESKVIKEDEETKKRLEDDL